jgi:serine/threonine protein kinase
MTSGPRERLTVRLRQSQTRYKPVSLIAAGGMAEVWRGEATLSDGEVVPVAIKRVLPNMDAGFRQMFMDEARLGMLLAHPNIVRVYDARDVGGTYIMIMELVDGDTLKGVTDRAMARRAPMPVPLALHIARELSRALGYAHDALDEQGKPLGIIHRDVSPHNLLLGVDGAVKLTDFGLADASVNQTARAEGMVGGKLGYLAPELIHQKPSDHRIDVFAVGICLWELLAGRRLFQGDSDAETVRAVARCEIPSLMDINAQVPAEVEQVVRGILHPDPEQRYQTGHDAAQALDALVAWLDPDVGPDDVALVTSINRRVKAKIEPPKLEPIGLADLLANELEQFQEKASDDRGEAPLDPSSFDLRSFGRR